MSFQPFHQRKFKPAMALLLITGLLSLVLPAFDAGAANDFYFIQVSQPKTPVCIGEARVITVSWDTEPFSDLAPLVPNSIKDPAPVTGPRTIYGQTPRKGELDRSTMHPAGPSGTTTFKYTANHEGPEVLIFQAMDNSLKSVGQNEITFEVKKCDYRFELFGQLDADASQGDVTYTFNFIFRAKGLLKADPNRPGYYEANSVNIALETNIVTFSFPDCALFTWMPGYGEGTVDVRGEQLGNDTMVVQFSPPQDLTWKLNLQAVCDGDPFSVNAQYPQTGDQDPWVEATFPYSAGIQSVQIINFEEGVNAARSGGMAASYTAFVTLSRVEPK